MLIDIIIDLIAGRRAAGVEPVAVMLSTERYAQLMRDQWETCRSCYSQFHAQIDGVPVHKRRPTLFCPSCGAPIEPVACSYCLRPSNLIEIQDSPTTTET